MQEIDEIVRPNHYKECSIECIDAMYIMLGAEGTVSFCLGNVLKYMWRFKSKNGLEDLAKAEEYIDFAMHMPRTQQQVELTINIKEILSKLAEEANK